MYVIFIGNSDVMSLSYHCWLDSALGIFFSCTCCMLSLREQSAKEEEEQMERHTSGRIDLLSLQKFAKSTSSEGQWRDTESGGLSGDAKSESI
jgi:hypothetical protein